MDAYDYGVKLALDELGLNKLAASVEELKNQASLKYAPPPKRRAPMPSPKPRMPSPSPKRPPLPPPRRSSPPPSVPPQRSSMSMGTNVPQQVSQPSLGTGMAGKAQTAIQQRKAKQQRALNL